MTQYFEIVARVPLTGDAMANARRIAALDNTLEAFTTAIETVNGTVETRTAKTKAPNNTATLPAPRLGAGLTEG